MTDNDQTPPIEPERPDPTPGQLTPAGLRRLLGSMNAADRAALFSDITLSGHQVATGPSMTPKMGPVLEQLDVEQIEPVVRACERGLKLAVAGAGDDDVLAPLAEVSPGLARAAVANSRYRKQDLAHSLRVIKLWIEHHHGAPAQPVRRRR